MEKKKEAPCWLTAQICLDPVMADAAVDFLTGVLAGAVEQSVTEEDDRSVLTVYFHEKDQEGQGRSTLKKLVASQFQELAAIFQVENPLITWQHIEDQDWSTNWKKHFTPFPITKGLVVVPTWESYTPAKDERVIVMDPGMAFGTGHHATTSMSLDLVRKVVQRSTGQVSLLDVGCGTGILGMGAALFGATQVLGIDNDPEAVRVARENIALNQDVCSMQISQIDLHELQGPFDCIVANIIHDVLLSMKNDFQRLLVKNGALIVSGILHGKQEQNILQCFAESGFFVCEREQKEEWAALYLQRK